MNAAGAGHLEAIEVLFVCTGNICRSPTAEAVFRHYVHAAGLSQRIQCESAGTHGYHIGEPPDVRSQRAAARRGYDLSALRARQVQRADYSRFHYLLAMADNHLALMWTACPGEHRAKLSLFMTHGAEGRSVGVPDPYYGGEKGFETVLDMVEDAAQGLLTRIRARHAL